MDNKKVYNAITDDKNIRISTEWVITIIVCLILCLFFAINFLIPYRRVEVTGNEVNNDYNNLLIGGSLARLGNHLYYSYNVTENKSGIIRIGQEGSKRIYWEGPYFLRPYRYAYDLRKYNNWILLGTEKIKCLDEKSGEFNSSLPDNIREDMSLNFQIFNGSLVYENDYVGYLDLTVWQDEVLSKITLENNHLSGTPYITETNVYYWEYDRENSEYFFHSMDVFSREDSILYSTTQFFSISSFLVEGHYLIFEGTEKLYRREYVCRIDLNNPLESEEVLHSHSSSGTIFRMNAYGGIVYIVTDEGIKTIDLKSKEVRLLCDKFAWECYILDDTWVYFVEDNGTLWRITQDGQNLEKVYGW